MICWRLFRFLSFIEFLDLAVRSLAQIIVGSFAGCLGCHEWLEIHIKRLVGVCISNAEALCRIPSGKLTLAVFKRFIREIPAENCERNELMG